MIELCRVGGENSTFDFDTRRPQCRRATVRHGVGIVDSVHDARDSCRDNRVHTGRRVAGVITWFERDVECRAAREFARHPQRDHFGVIGAVLRMPPFANDASINCNDRTNHRIWRHITGTAFCQRQRAPHEAPVECGLAGYRHWARVVCELTDGN